VGRVTWGAPTHPWSGRVRRGGLTGTDPSITRAEHTDQFRKMQLLDMEMRVFCQPPIRADELPSSVVSYT